MNISNNSQHSITFAFLSLFLGAIFVKSFSIPLNVQLISSHISSSHSLISSDYEQILRKTLLERVRLLASITEHPSSPGITRPYFSLAGTRARSLLFQMMLESGLSARIDPVGNVFGDVRCLSSPLTFDLHMHDNRGVVLLASHFDTVPHGGMWDGTYGVLASIAVAQTLKPYICDLPFDLQVAAFDDEEGASGFSVTNVGARAFAGLLNLSSDVIDAPAFAARFASVFNLNVSKSSFPTSFVDAVSARVNSAAASNSIERPYIAGLELHIEQGPTLQETGHAVAAVSAIAGQTRLRVVWTGTRGHAGTIPMSNRKDALSTAAKGVLLVEATARSVANWNNGNEDKTGRHIVATVGKLDVVNAGTNVIAGKVRMSVDIRAAEDDVRIDAVKSITEGFYKIGHDSGVYVEVEVVHEVQAVHMSPWITKVLEGAVDSPDLLVSGAGHDTQFMAEVMDVGMLFVRCRDGISHSPDEFVDEEDAYRGSIALLQAVQGLSDA